MLRAVYDKPGAKIFIPSAVDQKTGTRLVEISGDKQKIVMALQAIATILSEKASGETGLMINPLYYANMIGWGQYQNFAYPGEIQSSSSSQTTEQTSNLFGASKDSKKVEKKEENSENPEVKKLESDVEDRARLATENPSAHQYAMHYLKAQGGDYMHYYKHYASTYGNAPMHY